MLYYSWVKSFYSEGYSQWIVLECVFLIGSAKGSSNMVWLTGQESMQKNAWQTGENIIPAGCEADLKRLTATGAVPRRCSFVICVWGMSVIVSSLSPEEIWVRINFPIPEVELWAFLKKWNKMMFSQQLAGQLFRNSEALPSFLVPLVLHMHDQVICLHEEEFGPWFFSEPGWSWKLGAAAVIKCKF